MEILSGLGSAFESELFWGFLLGLFGNIWVSNVLQFPRSRFLQYFNWAAHPVRTMRSFIFPSFWCSRSVVRNIFKAWDSEDFHLYSAQWADGAIQITGHKGAVVSRDQILKNFQDRCGVYVEKETSILLVTEYQRISGDEVLIYVFYQSRLVRKVDRMPVIEEANEIYRIKKIKKRWVVTHNYDHFKGVDR